MGSLQEAVTLWMAEEAEEPRRQQRALSQQLAPVAARLAAPSHTASARESCNGGKVRALAQKGGCSSGRRDRAPPTRPTAVRLPSSPGRASSRPGARALAAAVATRTKPSLLDAAAGHIDVRPVVQRLTSRERCEAIAARDVQLA
jgi:hypothetical protein